jgi:hypothetical protein
MVAHPLDAAETTNRAMLDTLDMGAPISCTQNPSRPCFGSYELFHVERRVGSAVALASGLLRAMMVNCKSGVSVQWRRLFEALKSFHCKNSRTRISRTAATETAAGAARPTELVISSLAFCWKDISSVAPACNAPSCRFAVGAKSPASKITAEAAAIRMGDFKALSWQGFAFYY